MIDGQKFLCLILSITAALMVTACENAPQDGCPGIQTQCGGVCVDTATDRSHCGVCFRSCMDGEYCAGSQCVPCQDECQAGDLRCAAGSGSQYQECGRGADTCMLWQAPQDCPAGQECHDGNCGTGGCTDDCDLGDRECYGDGWRLCGEFDLDACLDWSDVTSCAADEICDAQTAECVRECKDECREADAHRCIPAPEEEGYEVCGDYDSDSCLEWGGKVLCPTGQTCDSATGLCSADCQDDCTGGQRVCDENENGFKVCGLYDADPCLDWSGITYCSSDESCNPITSQCEFGCQNECVTPGERRCSGDGYDICGDYDGDDCLEWDDHQACPEGTKCEAGQCVEGCDDECAPPGSRTCDGDGYRICGEFDQPPNVDSCSEWSLRFPCDVGQSCDNGVCIDPTECEDECETAGDRECFGIGWRECGDFDIDDCNDWSTVTPCASWQFCDGQLGQCVDVCEDDCLEDERRCRENGYVECGNFDADPCRELSGVLMCPEGEVCNPADGQCISGCEHECTPEQIGEQSCSGDGYDICGEYDSDPCLEWGGHVTCPAGTTCSNGECTEGCVDECQNAGDKVCDGNGYRVCGEYDEDDCLDLSSITMCSQIQECREGECVDVCQNDCALGERRCQANAYTDCGQYDDDPCYEWNPQATECTDQICYRGRCIDEAPTATVLINEILYDDASTDGEDVFIELWGPGGLSLDNYSLLGISGADGIGYMRIDLVGYSLPDDGHFVVVHSAADPSLVHVADLVDDRADLQNGPDSIQVLWGGTYIVDALGYEAHGSGQIFAGEGQPAQSADYDSQHDITYCLSRGADHADTNDNDSDFMKRTRCTPGWEGPGTVLWQAHVFGSTATPAIDLDGNVYISDSFGWIVKISPEGEVSDAWIPDTPAGDQVDALSSISVSADGQTLYVGSTNGLYALDADTLAPLDGWGPAAEGCWVFSSPAVSPSDGWIYFGTSDCGVCAVSPTGLDICQDLGTGIWADSSPGLGNIGPAGEEYAVFGAGDLASGRVVALNTSNLSIAWSFEGGANALTEPCDGSPAIGMDGSVYIGCDDGMLYALNGADGMLKSGFPVPVHYTDQASTKLVEGCSPATAPAVGGGEIIFMTSHADKGNVFIYGDDGTAYLAGTLANQGSSITLAANGTWLLHTGPFLGAYSESGRTEWYARLGDTQSDWVMSSPAIGPDSVVYVVEYKGPYSPTGYLYAIQGAADLYSNQGSFPKFRGDQRNSGNGF